MFAAMIAFGFVACKEEPPVPAASATFTVTVENVLPQVSYLFSGGTGLIMPGASESFTFNAGKGSYLSLATMFVQSNDLFYGFDDTGLALYDMDGNAITGDVTASIDLWDAGTEVNEEPGTGANQAPRQTGPNTGTDENGVVQLVSATGDGFTYPADGEIIQIEIAHDGGTEFTVTINNISNTASLGTPFAPGAWVIHNDGTPIFEDGIATTNGLEGIAEDGANSTLVDAFATASGYSSPFAPGVYAIHEAGLKAIFTNGEGDRGEGLEGLAEDGDPATLNTSLEGVTGISANGVFNTPEGASAAGPLLPGNSYSFTFTAEAGDYLSLATMLVQTNDLFYGFADGGLALFNGDIPVEGDVTASIDLWDAGTEVNEYPGAGNNQPVRGGGNSGPAENGNVQVVSDGFTYPAVSEGIKISISAQ